MAGEERPAISAPLLPQLFWSTYDSYSEEERERHRYLRRHDLCGIVCTAVVYCMVVYHVAPEDVKLPEPPIVVYYARCLFAALALYTLYLQIFVVTKTSKEMPEEFGVCGGPFGRFIWLTHQAIVLLAVHFVASTAGPLIGGRLAAGTHVASVILGGLGAFVTIQYCTLVRSHPDAVRTCRLWATRGVHMSVISDLLHVPQLLLALADVCFLKHRGSLLLLRPSLLNILGFFVCYCAVYVAALHANFALTSFWPYGLLKELGTSATRWAQFIVVQCSILSGFTFALLALPTITPAFW